jgi:hypothetical protein
MKLEAASYNFPHINATRRASCIHLHMLAATSPNLLLPGGKVRLGGENANLI